MLTVRGGGGYGRSVGRAVRTPSIATVEDLVRVLDEHPQWREAVRTRLLTRELLELPQRLADFAATTDRRFKAVDQQFAELNRNLAEFIANTDRRFEAAAQQFEELRRQLAESAANTDRRFEAAAQQSAELRRQLAESIANTDRRFAELRRQLAESIANTDRRFAELRRQLAESTANTNRQFDKLRTEIGPIKAAHAATSARAEADLMAEERGLTFVEFVEPKERWAMARGSDTGDISREELLSFRRADIVIRAADPDGAECYVAVEVSYTANGRDTKRAQRNARFLTRFTGQRADPVVASLQIDDRIRTAVAAGEVSWYKLYPQAFEVE